MEELYGPAHYSIYMIMFPNLKVYIGCTGVEPWGRWRSTYRKNYDLVEAIARYGKKNLDYFILEDGLTEEEAYEREKYWIDFYDATNLENGYNSASGGKKNIAYAERSIERYRAGAKRQFSDPEQREKSRMAHVHFPVICIETGVKYESCYVAESMTKVPHANINLVCRKKRHTAGGLHWAFA